jgi:hypothetical protein
MHTTRSRWLNDGVLACLLAFMMVFACCIPNRNGGGGPDDDDAGDDDVGDDDVGDDDDAGDDDSADDDDSSAGGGGNEDPLGAMYFNPYWVIHALADDCGSRRDAPCAFEPLGLSSIKFNDIKWRYIESNAPAGGVHAYDWSTLDGAVLRWEESGARAMFHLAPSSTWGVQDSRQIAEGVFGLDCDEVPGDCEDMPANPTAEHWADWEAWVTAMCERYDHDGVDDVPGLQQAHLEFQLLNEGQNMEFFVGTSEDYGELLQHTRAALDACNPDAELIHFGLTFNGLSHGGVTDEVFWQRVEEKAASQQTAYVEAGYRHAFAMMLGSPDPSATHDIEATVSMCQHFDVMAMHCNHSIEHMVEEYTFLRDELDSHGCHATPIICDDSTSAPALYSTFGLEWWDSSYGGADMTGEQIHEALGSQVALYDLFCDPFGIIPGSDLTYGQAREWHDRYHAAFVVKKASTALGLGMTRFMAGLLEDWRPESGCYWMHQGLTDSEGNVLMPLDFGEPRPAYHTLGLLRDKVIGYTGAARDVVDCVTVVTFERPGARDVHVVWYLDDDLPWPGDPEQTQAFDLEVGTDTALVTQLITEQGEHTAVSEVVATPGGVYSGVAAQTPFFVEPITEE